MNNIHAIYSAIVAAEIFADRNDASSFVKGRGKPILDVARAALAGQYVNWCTTHNTHMRPTGTNSCHIAGLRGLVGLDVPACEPEVRLLCAADPTPIIPPSIPPSFLYDSDGIIMAVHGHRPRRPLFRLLVAYVGWSELDELVGRVLCDDGRIDRDVYRDIVDGFTYDYYTNLVEFSQGITATDGHETWRLVPSDIPDHPSVPGAVPYTSFNLI